MASIRPKSESVLIEKPNIGKRINVPTSETGTAQSGVEGKPPYAWYVSFAPADDPQVAVAVMIESVPGQATDEIAGGLLGGPIAKAVMEAVIR